MTAEKIIERIIDRPKSSPFYIFGSFCSPHKPYDPPQRYLDMVEYEENDNFILAEGEAISDNDKKRLYRQRRAVKAMIKLIDDQIGRIFDILEKENLLKDTIIIFTSDHGDMLGDHFRIQKGVPWKQSSTVPLAVRHPDYLNKSINNTPVENIDIAATILDVAGIEPDEALSKDWPAFNDVVAARSLMPIIKGEKERIRDFSFSECTFKEDKNTKKDGSWQMIQNENWKYVRYLNYDLPGVPEEEFYDLKTDPDELVNLIGESSYREAIQWCRDRRDYLLDHTPSAQTRWAPLME